MNELELFAAAISIGDPVERAVLLDRECAGRTPLRERIDQLINEHYRSNEFLDQPQIEAVLAGVGPAPTIDAGPGVKAGAVIAGRYKLLQQIGEGGMGSVWMADQTEPVKRRVAVKLIRIERGQSATVLSRFEAERQAIALMDHPNIAKLFDAGKTEDSSPYFVMELVKGVPLTDYCDSHKLSIPDRLRLFIQICSAVQHAHQKGIIHRDLKPTNILVESHDGKPVPKIIDFGLAKATSGIQLSENTLFTGFGSVMGTPLYMAPEQANFNAVDVDTRADIYALGVILYELLAGSTPITRETVKRAALDELLRMIREQDAPTPSSRVSTSEAKPKIAANRQIEPEKFGRFVRGELDWIVMKALCKERERRYGTANGFAMDVERFLNNQPVTAGPPTAAYRLRKFIRRNKGRVVAASLVLVVLLGGMIGTGIGMMEARKQRDAAEAAREQEAGARMLADNAAAAERVARQNESEARSKAEQAAIAEKAASSQSRRQLYFNQIALAQKYWQADDAEQLEKLLDNTPAEFRNWEWHYLNHLRHPELLTLPGNGQFTWTLALSGDGTRLLAFANTMDTGAVIWDLATQKPLATISTSNTDRSFFSGTLSPDGRTVVLGERNGTVTLWDSTTGKPGRELGKLSSEIHSLSVSSDGKWVLAAAGSMGKKPDWRIWDLASGDAVPVPAEIPLAISFAPDGRVLGFKKNANTLFSQSSGQVQLMALWDLATGKEDQSLGSVASYAFSTDGKRLAVGGLDEKSQPQIRVFDLPKKTEILSVAVPALGDLAFSPDGKLLITSNQFGRSLNVWDLKSGLLVRTLHGHTGFINAVSFTPDGRLVSCSWDRTIRFWDPSVDQEVVTLPGIAQSKPSEAAIDANGKGVAFVCGGRLGSPVIFGLFGGDIAAPVYLWSPNGVSQVATGHLRGTDRVVYSTDGSKMLAGSQSGQVTVLDMNSNARICGFQHDGSTQALAISPDGKLAVSSHEPNEVSNIRIGRAKYREIPGSAKVWDAGTGDELYTLDGHTTTVYASAISHDGAFIATASSKQLRIWNATSGHFRFEIRSPEVGSSGLAFDPSGTIVATASDDAVVLWDSVTGTKLAELPGKGGKSFGAFAFSPDGSRVVTAFGDAVRVWATSTGQEILTLPIGNENLDVLAIRFVSDRGRILAAFSDGSVRAWEAPTQE